MLKKSLVVMAMVLGLGMFGAGSVAAYSITSGDAPTMGADQVVNGPMYTSGSTVRVGGTVNGDLYCFGQMIEVTGTVNGDVLCAGQQVKVTGTVNGDIRIAAQAVSLEGSVAGSVSAAAQVFELGDKAKIGYDASIMAQTATISGSIGRDLVSSNDSTTINGHVGGSAKLAVRMLTLNSAASVVGAIDYTSNLEATIQSGAKTGAIQRQDLPQQTGDKLTGSLASNVGSATYLFLAMLLVGVVMVLVKPRLLVSVAEKTYSETGVVFGWGLAVVMGVPFVAAIAGLSIIGLPLMFILMTAWALVVAMSVIFSSHTLGSMLIKSTGMKIAGRWLQFASLTVGLFIIMAATLVLLLGIIVCLLAVLMGAGGLARVLIGKTVGQGKVSKGRLV